MKVFTEYLKFHTKTHRAYVHITPQVEEIVRNSGVQEGMVLVSAMHITAGVYVNDDESGLIEESINGWSIWRRSGKITSITRLERITAIRI
ncbi:MAG: YjbQ family protein [Candidatus Sulfotelmatobacter sp.]